MPEIKDLTPIVPASGQLFPVQLSNGTPYSVDVDYFAQKSNFTSFVQSGNEIYIKNSGVNSVKYTNTGHFHYVSGVEISHLSTGGLLIQPGGITSGLNSCAALELFSSFKGLLLPRMSSVQMSGIASPVSGLLIYNHTLNKACIRTATVWEQITSTAI